MNSENKKQGNLACWNDVLTEDPSFMSSKAWHDWSFWNQKQMLNTSKYIIQKDTHNVPLLQNWEFGASKYQPICSAPDLGRGVFAVAKIPKDIMNSFLSISHVICIIFLHFV